MYVSSKLFQGVSLGILTGTLTAIGGAFKDVAYEKFELSKFVRSPIMAALGGLIIVHFATSSDLLVFASFGFERIIVECYKTFIRRKKRGIFEGQKPNHLFWMNARPVFIGTYVLAFAALVYNFLI
jgi:hypothetical protein